MGTLMQNWSIGEEREDKKRQRSSNEDPKRRRNAKPPALDIRTRAKKGTSSEKRK
jgi:hypothetical protein